MDIKLLTEHSLEFLSLIGGCRGSSESALIKMSSCWKSHAAAQLYHLHTLHYNSGLVLCNSSDIASRCEYKLNPKD